jgi:hypothetical protein
VDDIQGRRLMSIPREEWHQMTLVDRLHEHYIRVPEIVDPELLREDLLEAARRIERLRTKLAEAEVEARRLERLVHAPSPY